MGAHSLGAQSMGNDSIQRGFARRRFVRSEFAGHPIRQTPPGRATPLPLPIEPRRRARILP